MYIHMPFVRRTDRFKKKLTLNQVLPWHLLKRYVSRLIDTSIPN